MKKGRRAALHCALLFLALALLAFPVHASAASKARLNKTSISLMKGNTFRLKVKKSSKKVKWKSSKKSVASVDSGGTVTANKKGTAVITAKVGKKKLTCRVTVKQPVKKVKLSASRICVKKGKKYTLKATVSPKSANNRSLSWSTSDKKVAKVSSSGKITAVGIGNAVITARTKDGSNIAVQCSVCVTKTGEWPLEITPSSLLLTVSQSSRLTYRYAKGTINWTSSNPAVATVSADGTVSASGVGSAVITAVSANETASCTVTSQPPSPSPRAYTFLNILNKYSRELQAHRAQGHLVGYSNAGGLNENNWVPAMEEMNSKGTTYTNCALLVRWALREMGYIGTTQNFWGINADGGACHSWCYSGIHFASQTVKNKLLEHCEIIEVHDTPANLVSAGKLIPGDICTWHGMVHTNVYAGTDAAGNGLWYDAGRGPSDGEYWLKEQILAFGISEDTWKDDKKKGGSNPSLSRQTYVFNSFGPVAEPDRYVGGRVGYIIRIVK